MFMYPPRDLIRLCTIFTLHCRGIELPEERHIEQQRAARDPRPLGPRAGWWDVPSLRHRLARHSHQSHPPNPLHPPLHRFRVYATCKHIKNSLDRPLLLVLFLFLVLPPLRLIIFFSFLLLCLHICFKPLSFLFSDNHYHSYLAPSSGRGEGISGA